MAICSGHARKLLHRPGWVKPPRAPHTPDPMLASEVAPKLLPSTSGPSSLDCQLPGQVSPSSLCVLPSSGPGTCWGHNAHLLCDKQNATGCTHQGCSRHLPVPGAAGPLPPRAPRHGSGAPAFQSIPSDKPSACGSQSPPPGATSHTFIPEQQTRQMHVPSRISTPHDFLGSSPPAPQASGDNPGPV